MQTIEDKIKSGRCETVEFLTTIDEISDVAKIIISFANNNGGSLFVGVNPKGKLIGILPEPELKLVDEVNDYVNESVTIESTIHTVKHYFILEISVPKSNLPLKMKLNNSSHYYYRIETETVEANKIIASFLNLQKFQKIIVPTSDHNELLRVIEGEVNLSTLYNSIDLKPNTIDKCLGELIYLDKVKIHFFNKAFYYSKK